MDLQKFKHYYLPKAMTDDEIGEDRREGRTITEQLSSFGFFDTKYDCPTNAGMLFFAKNLRRFIQYVRFAGKNRAGESMTEHEFKSNLCTTLQELDTFVETTIANRCPIPVSSIREDPFVDYPYWATRELQMTIFDEKPSDLTENDEGKQRKVSIPDFPTMLTWNVYEAIKMNRKAKYFWLADNLGVSEATIKRAIADLKELWDTIKMYDV